MSDDRYDMSEYLSARYGCRHRPEPSHPVHAKETEDHRVPLAHLTERLDELTGEELGDPTQSLQKRG